ncbi:MAG: DUF5916 domain-containing protein, partial [Bacteroidota bacterium]
MSGQDDQNFPPPESPPIIQAIRTQQKITLDGRLEEADWFKAPVVEEFFRMEPRQGGTYQHRTEVRLLFDETNLYVGVYAKDSLGRRGIRMQDLRRDFDQQENDLFGLQLDPQRLKQYCVSFQTTPHGSQRDLQNFNDNNTDVDWNALWQVRTTRTDSGYYAEFAIPFKSIRYQLPQAGDSAVWGITFFRLARRDFEQTVFPAIPQSFSPYRMTYAAQLKGLELPPPSTNVRIEPYTLYQLERTIEGGEEVLNQVPKLGGDVKWAINPQSVVDLTFNTDFAQADLDRAVNNLERFNIFFPERRQFFLENSGIWAGANSRSIVPFFSRRIGLQGEFNATPAPIVAGARYTQRTQKRTIAGLYMRQAETEISPSANFAVGRYTHNFGKENNAGVMLTHRLNDGSDELGMAPGHNTTLTVDGLIRPRSEMTISYMLSASQDGSNDTLGAAGSVFVGYQANDFYAGWRSEFVSKEYRPDMGFVFQQDVISHDPGGYFIWRPKNLPWIRRWDPGVFTRYYHDMSNPGNFQQANLYIFPVYIIFTNGSFLEYNLRPTWQNINFAFSPLGISIAEGNYYYLRQEVRFNTNQSARLSTSGSISWGEFYNGSRSTVRAGVRYAPVVQASLAVDYEYNDLRGLGVAEEDLETHLVSLGGRFALNPRLQLSLFYQYNSFDQQGRWNVRASWEYQPLSFIYLVFNDTRTDDFVRPE